MMYTMYTQGKGGCEWIFIQLKKEASEMGY